ncbi:MAG TPA: hypothetical protein VHX61_15225 [Rhizomicrobium sp.]|jgi:hypothetical protein|nr:hypothetical protein [Rhizomicrobium sp.]
MKDILKVTTAAAALLGSAVVLGGPARAADWSVGIGAGPGIGFDVHSGGYCDRWGCPGDYWNLPVYYGPVYYDGQWYRGPEYYRVKDGVHWYWINGAWHRDQWEGPRPGWARVYHYGPPLGLAYYREHGFRVSDRDWQRWNGNGHWYHAGYNQDRYGAEDEDRYRDDQNWYNNDRNYRGDQGRDHGDGYNDRDQYDQRDQYRDEDRSPPPEDQDRGGYQQSGYDNDRNPGGQDRMNGYHARQQAGYRQDRDPADDARMPQGGPQRSGARSHSPDDQPGNNPPMNRQ